MDKLSIDGNVLTLGVHSLRYIVTERRINGTCVVCGLNLENFYLHHTYDKKSIEVFLVDHCVEVAPNTYRRVCGPLRPTNCRDLYNLTPNLYKV